MSGKKKLKIKNCIYFVLSLFILVLIIFLIKNLFFDNTKPDTNKKNSSSKTEKKEKVGEAPVIKINGEESIKIVLNSPYEDLGALATDKEDGNLTKIIKVNNKVKTEKAGEYVVEYTVSDKDGNTVKKERKVTVFEVKDKDTDGIPVFMYHYFYDDKNGGTGPDSNYLASSLFEEQLKYLSENDYYFPTMKELNYYLDGKIDLPSKSAILTLDDGAESNYSIAYPLAKKYKVPLVMFVVTSWTDVSMELQTEMTNSGYIRFHSHTDDMHQGGCGEQHGALILCINHDSGVKDLKTSAEKIGNADALAYPCGDTNDSAKSIVGEAGFSLAFTTSYGVSKRGLDKLALPRLRINDGISLQSFISML